MNNKQITCDPQRIELFLGQKLSDEEQTAFEAHLDDCNDCRRRLEAAAAGDDVWSGVRDSLLGQQLPPDCLRSGEPALDSATGGDASFSHETVLKLLAPTDDDRMIGRLGTYEVVGVIGSGGMGVVLKAFDGALNRYVAIKVLAPHLGSSGSARKRFSREAQAAAAVVHDNVMEIHGVADAEGLPYLVMPYVRGPSLQRRLDDDGPLALVEILRIAVQAAAGLAAAHAQGLVHRDVKPANILLADGVERVKLTDFGLARAADDASLTRTGIIAGTPQYMSPEQARGESVGQKSDLFSLGSVLYAMCTGRVPFRAETSYGVLRRVTDEEPRPIRQLNPDIPEWLCQIIAKLMSKQPDDRYESAREVTELLEECLAHVQQPTVVPLPQRARPPASPASKTQRRWPVFRLLVGAAFAFTMIFAGILIVLELNKGTLTIESDANNVPVRVTQGDKVVEKLTITRTGTSVRIAAGRYEIELLTETDGLVVKNGTFTLIRGKEHVVTIEQVETSASPAPSVRRAEPGETPPWALGMEVLGMELASVVVFSKGNKVRYRGGIAVRAVRRGSRADHAGIRAGDVLVSVDQWEVDSHDKLTDVLKLLSEGVLPNPLKLFVYRNNELLFATIQFPTSLEEGMPLEPLPRVPSPRVQKVPGTIDSSDNPAQIKTIQIHVVDENNKPIENATVLRNHVYAPGESQRSKIENAKFDTDASGTTAINLSGMPQDLRLWVTKNGFVPLHAMWAVQFQSDGHAIPDEFTFAMKRGTEIGGVVVDEMGHPIPNVGIAVRDTTVDNSIYVNPKRPGKRPIGAYMLAEGKAVVTDSQGRWALNNVPSDEVLAAGRSSKSSVGAFGEPLQPKQFLQLRFIHPRYVENAWGRLQLKHDVTLDSLRAKTAKVVLQNKLIFGESSKGRDLDLVLLCTQAQFHAALLKTLQFAYYYESDCGLTGNAKFASSGDRFRLDRVDITGGKILGDKSSGMSLSTAYNGNRQQRLDVKQSLLRLKNGNDGVIYGLAIPQTLAYAWLRMHGTPPLRWDSIVGGTLWEERFAEATYVGKVNRNGRILEVVEFPQRKGLNTPCIWKVYFDPDLGYLPIKYVRRVEKTGEVSSTMEVTRFKTFDIAGHTIGVPTEVNFQETGADSVSLVQKKTYRVDEGSLKVNEDVEDRLFTIDRRGVKNTYINGSLAHPSWQAMVDVATELESAEQELAAFQEPSFGTGIRSAAQLTQLVEKVKRIQANAEAMAKTVAQDLRKDNDFAALHWDKVSADLANSQFLSVRRVIAKSLPALFVDPDLWPKKVPEAVDSPDRKTPLRR